MKITYTIQVCNESRELFSLLSFLLKVKDEEDNINVVYDENNITDKVKLVLEHFKENIVTYGRPFDNFSINANFHIQMATGDYIFGLDADEIPQEFLIKNIKNIIEESKAELLYIPRVNIHPGITDELLKQYSFNLNNAGFINWPDYQGRIYKRCDYIKWTDTLHTKLYGTDNVLCLKPDVNLALWHIKSIEKQQSRWKLDDNNQYNINSPSKNNLYDLLM